MIPDALRKEPVLWHRNAVWSQVVFKPHNRKAVASRIWYIVERVSECRTWRVLCYVSRKAEAASGFLICRIFVKNRQNFLSRLEFLLGVVHKLCHAWHAKCWPPPTHVTHFISFFLVLNEHATRVILTRTHPQIRCHAWHSLWTAPYGFVILLIQRVRHNQEVKPALYDVRWVSSTAQWHPCAVASALTLVGYLTVPSFICFLGGVVFLIHVESNKFACLFSKWKYHLIYWLLGFK